MPIEVRFRYDSRRAGLLAAASMAVLFAVIGVLSATSGRQGAGRAVAVAVVGFVLFSTGGVFLALAQADVVVDDNGLSRRLRGRTLKEIRWNDVQKIRVFEAYDRYYRRMSRVFQVFPKHSTVGKSGRSSKIWFLEQGDFGNVIEEMNRHILANGIPVEVKRRGDPSWAIRSRIESS